MFHHRYGFHRLTICLPWSDSAIPLSRPCSYSTLAASHCYLEFGIIILLCLVKWRAKLEIANAISSSSRPGATYCLLLFSGIIWTASGRWRIVLDPTLWTPKTQPLATTQKWYKTCFVGFMDQRSRQCFKHQGHVQIHFEISVLQMGQLCQMYAWTE